MIFRVKGTLIYEDRWYCECKHCDGHGSGETIYHKIDQIVKARFEEQAIQQALASTLKSIDTDIEEYEWDSIEVSDAPPDIQMRMIGAPMLPGFEEADHAECNPHK